MHEESRLFWYYVTSTCFFVLSLITTSLSWSHWAYTINILPSYNCECILFGKAFSDRFSGGDTVYCQLVTFLQIPLFLTASFLSFYQGRRASTVNKERRRLMQQNRSGGTLKNPILVLKSRDGRTLHEGDVLVEEKTVEMEPPSHCASVAIFVISVICLLLLFTVFLLFTIGFERSCKEYRKVLINLIKASGNMAQVISERLSCTSIFDYMDYLQPKRRIHDRYDDERKIMINTGATLLVAEIALVCNLVCWFYITVIQGKVLRKRLRFNRKFPLEGKRNLEE